MLYWACHTSQLSQRGCTMNPVLLNFPDVLESARLHLRSPRAGDGPEMARAINDSLAELRPWMPWAQGHSYDDDQAEDFCRRWQAKFLLREELAFFLYDQASGAQVGACSLHSMDWEAHKFELGYWLRTPYQGQGYMSEAVARVGRFAWESLGAVRLEIRCDSRNLASQRVALRAGYTHEATLRRDSLGVEGEWRDTMIFGLLREEWQYGTASGRHETA